MPVLPAPALDRNENSPYLSRVAPRAVSGPNATPSEAQVGFIRSLLADRDTSDADRALQGLIDAYQDGTLSRGNASKLIDLLKKLPWQTKMATWQPRGFEQAVLPVPVPTSYAPAPEGYHCLTTAQGPAFYQVKTSKSSGRRYSMLWDGARWDYEAGRSALRQLSEATLITAEQAKMFGDEYHSCIFCHQTLTDQRSIDAGYGPVCAANHSLPWGEVTFPTK